MSRTKIQRVSRILRIFTVLGLLGLGAMVLLFAVFMPMGYYLMPREQMEVLDAPSFIITFLLYGVSTFCFIYTLEHLRRLFTKYMHGDVVSNENAVLIQKAGFGLLCGGVVEIIVAPVAALVTRLTNGPEEFAKLDAVAFANIGFLFAAGLLIVIGWAMSDAARAAEDGKWFV